MRGWLSWLFAALIKWAAKEYLLKYAWKLGNLAARELADHAPINYVWAVSADQP